LQQFEIAGSVAAEAKVEPSTIAFAAKLPARFGRRIRPGSGAAFLVKSAAAQLHRLAGLDQRARSNRRGQQRLEFSGDRSCSGCGIERQHNGRPPAAKSLLAQHAMRAAWRVDAVELPTATAPVPARGGRRDRSNSGECSAKHRSCSILAGDSVILWRSKKADDIMDAIHVVGRDGRRSGSLLSPAEESPGFTGHGVGNGHRPQGPESATESKPPEISSKFSSKFKVLQSL